VRVGDAVAVLVRVQVEVGVDVRVGGAVSVAVEVGVELGRAVAVGVRVEVGIRVAVGVRVGVGVDVGLGDGVLVGVRVDVGDGASVEVAVGTAVSLRAGKGIWGRLTSSAPKIQRPSSSRYQSPSGLRAMIRTLSPARAPPLIAKPVPGPVRRLAPTLTFAWNIWGVRVDVGTAVTGEAIGVEILSCGVTGGRTVSYKATAAVLTRPPEGALHAMDARHTMPIEPSAHTRVAKRAARCPTAPVSELK